jgi:hypothetical protein
MFPVLCLQIDPTRAAAIARATTLRPSATGGGGVSDETLVRAEA